MLLLRRQYEVWLQWAPLVVGLEGSSTSWLVGWSVAAFVLGILLRHVRVYRIALLVLSVFRLTFRSATSHDHECMYARFAS